MMDSTHTTTCPNAYQPPGKQKHSPEAISDVPSSALPSSLPVATSSGGKPQQHMAGWMRHPLCLSFPGCREMLQASACAPLPFGGADCKHPTHPQAQ